MFRPIALVLAAASLLPARLPAESISSVKLERTACHGTCPIYGITISSIGDVKYVGKDFVKVKGIRLAHMTPQQFAQLMLKAEQIRFFDLDDSYSHVKIGDSMIVITDLPTTIVSVTRGGTTKQVRDYTGAPKGLYEFEQLIERIANSERWTGRRDELQDVPYYDHFPLNHRTTFRGVLRRQWTGPLENLRVTGYHLELPKNNLTFRLHAENAVDLSKVCGDLVDATGALENSNSFHLTSVRSVRHVFDDKKPWP